MDLTTCWHTSIKDIPKDCWDALVGEDASPFFKWEWLLALEESQSISQRQGWQTLYLGLWQSNNLIGVAPLYLKGHSYGEFVFDNQFAELARELGLKYYPKLIGMSPFSPVEGYKFYISKGEDKEKLTNLMMKAIDDFAYRNEILSCNFLYVDNDWQPIAEKSGCAKWINQKSLWLANGQKDFSDYLASFNSNQRRNIRRERKAIQDSGVILNSMTGSEIDIKAMHLMYDFYEQHCSRWGIWGSKYLSKKFFSSLSNQPLKEQLVVFTAHKDPDEDPIAMSLCVKNKSSMWGRYWGSKEEIDYLHFELCYYTPIEWALNHGISSFDPGAGGSHKRRRGFISQPNISLHRWYEPRMDSLIRSWLPKVNKLIIEEIKTINSDLPFRVEIPPITFVK